MNVVVMAADRIRNAAWEGPMQLRGRERANEVARSVVEGIIDELGEHEGWEWADEAAEWLRQQLKIPDV